MATRRDQLHSYQFLTQRVISAFVMRETDPQQSPLRRGIGAIFGGLMIAVLVAAGFGIYGIITKVGTDRWKTQGSVVIEKETGATYVYLDGVLVPTLNYASARLIAGGTGGQFRESTKSLSDAPRGVPVGIPNAPTSLPDIKNRVGMPWTVCATPETTTSGQRVSRVTLAVATSPSGGRTLGDQGLLVRDASEGTVHLIWHGRRHAIQDPGNLVPALFGSVSAMRVGTAWLNALPAGGAISRIAVTGRGQASGAVPGRKNGDVLVAQTGSGPQYFLVQANGLLGITPLQQAILAAEWPDEPETISIAEANPLTTGRQATGDPYPPERTPTLLSTGDDDQVCAVTPDAVATPTISVGASVAGLDTATPTTGASEDRLPLADRILVPPGKVAIVRAVSGPDAETGVFYVVTDIGVKFAVPSAEVLAALGYPPGEAVNVPATLVAQLPSGPALDPAAATRPAAAAAPN
ncbi:type VII secretion protein EccB [Actinomycetes bacterium KLBMP 9797]